jgi:integrase
MHSVRRSIVNGPPPQACRLRTLGWGASAVMAGLGANASSLCATSGPSEKVQKFLFQLLTPASQWRYEHAWQAFAEWLAAHAVDFAGLSEEVQDYVLGDYVLDMSDEGTPLQRLRDTVAAAQKRYGGRRKYRTTAAVIEGLNRGHVVHQAAPFPQDLLLCVVVVLTHYGKAAVGVSLLLCFCGLLRISEAIGLRHQDVLFPEDHRSGPFVVLLLQCSKRGAKNSEKVMLDNPRVIEFLRRYKLSLDKCFRLPHKPFCVTSYSGVRKYLRKALRALGLAPDTFRTHSCRRGGATLLAMQGVAILDIMLAGRWASHESCRLYVRKGEVALMRFHNALSETTWQRIQSIGRIGEKVWDCVSNKC